MTENKTPHNTTQQHHYNESHGTGVISSMIFLIIIGVAMFFIAKFMGM